MDLNTSSCSKWHSLSLPYRLPISLSKQEGHLPQHSSSWWGSCHSHCSAREIPLQFLTASDQSCSFHPPSFHLDYRSNGCTIRMTTQEQPEPGCSAPCHLRTPRCQVSRKLDKILFLSSRLPAPPAQHLNSGEVPKIVIPKIPKAMIHLVCKHWIFCMLLLLSMFSRREHQLKFTRDMVIYK